ncbi:MAG: hypothetical protein ACERKZ_12500 [Lachnotalea sp.]
MRGIIKKGMVTIRAIAIGAVAGLVVGDEIPLLYYKQYYYEKKLVNPPLAIHNFVVASKWVTYYYSDKKHTRAVGNKVTNIVYQ